MLSVFLLKGSIMQFFKISLLCAMLLMSALPTFAQSADQRVIYINDAQEVIALTPATNEQSVLLAYQTEFARAYGLHVAPDQQHVAIFLRLWDQAALDSGQPSVRGFRLFIVRISDAAVLLDQDLLPEGYTDTGSNMLGDPTFEMIRALGEIKWSPDGQQVAYISGQSGTADLWTFNVATQETTQRDSNPDVAAFINWSPDGSTIIFSRLETFGTGGGYTLNEVDRVTLTDNSVTPIPLAEPASSQGISIIGWLDAERVLYAPVSFIAGASGLYELNLTTLAATEILPREVEMSIPVFDAETQSAAFIIPDLGMETVYDPGAYVWSASAEQPIQVRTGTFYFAERITSGLFLLQAFDATYVYDVRTPTLMTLPPNDFGAFVAPSGQHVVLYRADGVYVSSLSADDASLIWNGEAQVPVWSADGNFFYSFGITEQGAGLLQFDVVKRSYQLLDTRMAVNSPIATVGE